MKICLQVEYGISSFRFEHPGEQLTLGRGPDNTIAFPGDPGRNVAWTHARIELTPQGAFLSDQGAETGTYLNDRRIDQRTRVTVGDRIALSADGPRLRIEALELPTESPVPAAPASDGEGWWQGQPAASALPAPSPAALSPHAAEPPLASIAPAIPRPGPSRQVLAVLVAVAVLGGTAAVLIGVAVGRRAAPPPSSPVNAEVAKQPPETSVPIATPVVQPPVPTPVVKPPPPEVKPPPPVPAPPVDALPRVERANVGTYVHPASAPPSILVERRRDAERWARIRPGQRVYTSSHLVSMPGCRSRIQLDSAINLELWGNVPEFSNFPPVLECGVMLHEPAAGFDLDFTLDRGRVHVSSVKPEGAARVRVRFQRETWDLTLPDAKSAVVLERWGSAAPGIPKEPGETPPEQCLGLFTHGPAVLRLGERTIPLADQSRFAWTSAAGAVAAPEALPRLPAWWTDRIAPDDERRADMMLALQDYDDRLKKEAAVIDAVMTELRETPVPANRLLGVLFLGALDVDVALVECLEDRNHPEVRGVAAFCLRQWLARGRDAERDLFFTLHDRKGYSREKATIIVQLLHVFAAEARKDPRTFDLLIGYLNHDNLSIRDLAFWHLVLLAPELAKKVTYRPTDPAETRAAAIQQWRKLVPSGSTPPP